jgi:hypothetical protein
MAPHIICSALSLSAPSATWRSATQVHDTNFQFNTKPLRAMNFAVSPFRQLERLVRWPPMNVILPHAQMEMYVFQLRTLNQDV